MFIYTKQTKSPTVGLLTFRFINALFSALYEQDNNSNNINNYLSEEEKIISYI